MYIHIYIYIHTYIHSNIYIFVYIYIYICHTYVCTLLHTHTYHIETLKDKPSYGRLREHLFYYIPPVAGPIFGPLSTRSIEGFHFEHCLISRFYFVPNLVGNKSFPTKEHLTRIRTFVENVFTVSSPKRIN